MGLRGLVVRTEGINRAWHMLLDFPVFRKLSVSIAQLGGQASLFGEISRVTPSFLPLCLTIIVVDLLSSFQLQIFAWAV